MELLGRKPDAHSYPAYIGLDNHKETIATSVVRADRVEAQFKAEITNKPKQVIKLIDQLIRAYTWEGHPYIAEDYGQIVLIEPQDTERVLDEIWDG